MFQNGHYYSYWWRLSLISASRSRIFDTVTQLEMGRKFDRTGVSKPGFLSSGRTRAVLNADGKQHSRKDRLAMWARTGAKTPIDWRRSGDGNRGDDLMRIVYRTSWTSSTDTGKTSASRQHGGNLLWPYAITCVGRRYTQKIKIWSIYTNNHYIGVKLKWNITNKKLYWKQT